MAKDYSNLEGLVSNVKESIRNAYDKGYKQGVNDGSLDVKMRVDGVYEKGLNDAWECARKIMLSDEDGGIAHIDIQKIFGGSYYTALMNYSASEAIAKINEYEEKQKQADDEIKVGDEVIWNDHVKGIVIEIIDCNLRGFTSRLCPFEWRKEFCRRTGRHFDELPKIIQQLRGEQDEAG